MSRAEQRLGCTPPVTHKSVTAPVRRHSAAKKNTEPTCPMAEHHQNQFVKSPPRASPETRSGVSDEKVVATIEVPATHLLQLLLAMNAERNDRSLWKRVKEASHCHRRCRRHACLAHHGSVRPATKKLSVSFPPSLFLWTHTSIPTATPM